MCKKELDSEMERKSSQKKNKSLKERGRGGDNMQGKRDWKKERLREVEER